MIQSPKNALVAKGPNGNFVPLNCDADGNLIATTPDEETPATTSLNVAASTVFFAGPGEVIGFNVVVAGAAGALHDVATVGAAAAGNKIATTPAVVGYYPLPWPVSLGFVYVVGAGQTISAVYRANPA